MNKVTASAKEAFQLAFDELGGVQGMVDWVRLDPDNKKVFYGLYSKLIPQDVRATIETMTVDLNKAL